MDLKTKELLYVRSRVSRHGVCSCLCCHDLLSRKLWTEMSVELGVLETPVAVVGRNMSPEIHWLLEHLHF